MLWPTGANSTWPKGAKQSGLSTTEETEKVEVMNRAAQLGGDIETAIRQLAQEKRAARNR